MDALMTAVSHYVVDQKLRPPAPLPEPRGDPPEDRVVAARFYELLGFRFTNERHGSGPEHYSAQVGGTVFEIYPRQGADDSAASVRLGFVVESVDAAVERLTAEGARMIALPESSPWAGGR